MKILVRAEDNSSFNTVNGASALSCLVVLASLALLLGCASSVPKNISKTQAQPHAVKEVQQSPEAFDGNIVRWGGEIIAVHNRAEVTEIEILARTLYSGGQPMTDGKVDARFLARINGFLDPADYLAGQRMTVFGHIAGTTTHKVGDYPYQLPVVRVESYYRWPKVEYLSDPYWYHYPFYSPWRRYDRWGDPYWW